MIGWHVHLSLTQVQYVELTACRYVRNCSNHHCLCIVVEISDPRKISDSTRGSTIPASIFTEAVDVAPTILDACNIAKPAQFQGNSIIPLLALNGNKYAMLKQIQQMKQIKQMKQMKLIKQIQQMTGVQRKTKQKKTFFKENNPTEQRHQWLLL